MMASQEEEELVTQRAYVAYSNDPRVEGLTVLPDVVSSLLRNMVAVAAELDEVRIDLQEKQAANAECADDDPEADAPDRHLRARYDGEISIRTRARDVELFQNLADERDWSYGRMFQELLKSYDQPYKTL
jgi:hypothetical protein